MTSKRDYQVWRPHPWHGIEIGEEAPRIVTAYIEMTPFDLVKYETDKHTGYIRVDRPQRSSVHPPALYGFIPRTLCAQDVATLSGTAYPGDDDPLDICVLSERSISRANIIMDVRIIGGLTMIDHEEVDDKIIAVLRQDNIWGEVTDVSDMPPVLVERLVHYFETYKWVPGEKSNVTVTGPYGREHAWNVVDAARRDYDAMFGGATP